MRRSDRRLYGSARRIRREDEGEGREREKEKEESKAKRIKEEQRKEQEVDAVMRWGRPGRRTRGKKVEDGS